MVNVRLQQQHNPFLHPLKPPPPPPAMPLVCLITFCVCAIKVFFLLYTFLGPFLLVFIYLSEVVFRDVACHSSAWPIKHTVMTGWPRSKLITDWLTERVAPFCSAVFDSCLPDITAQEILNALVSFLSPLFSAIHSRSHEYGFTFLPAHTY